MTIHSKKLCILNKTTFWVTLIIFILLKQNVYSQIGLGAKGAINYPGLSQSDKNGIRFNPGIGYGFFIRHDVYSFSSYKMDFRYSAVISNHIANLPLSGNTKYDFSNFSIDVIFKSVENNSQWYGGFALNLLSAVSHNKYINDYSSETIYPSLFAGWKYNWAEGFDVFVEFSGGFGETKAGPEKIPITGLNLHTGITMYISE